MINLLPLHEKKIQARAYHARRRVATGALILLVEIVAVLLAGGLIGAKWYEKKTAEDFYASLAVSANNAGRESVTKEVVKIRRRLAELAKNQQVTTASAAILEILTVRPAGLQISAIQYRRAAPQAGAPGQSTLSLRGVAKTRNDLLLFVDSLKSLDIFSGIDSPVGNLVRERDAPFLITLTRSSTGANNP
jgi:hypothetical protein